MRRTLAMAPLLTLLWPAVSAETTEELSEEVRRAEGAFAKAMADRDHAAFTSFLAADTLFFSRQGVRSGKVRVALGWKPFYESKEASFSWAPANVEVLKSGGLAFSSGPVFDPAGKRVGTFNSVWRKEKDGKWRIIFDKGCPPCDCGQAKSNP